MDRLEICVCTTYSIYAPLRSVFIDCAWRAKHPSGSIPGYCASYALEQSTYSERAPLMQAVDHLKTRRAWRGISSLTTMALVGWLVWAPLSHAFHDSILDPQSKRALAGLLEDTRSLCRAGNSLACTLAPQVQAFGNELARTQQACARGDQRACQVSAQAEQQLSLLMQQVGSLWGSPAPPMPPGRSWAPNAQPRGEPRANPRSGGGGACSRCDLYSTRELNCGKDCTFINPYREHGDRDMSACMERAAQCRAEASRAWERCLDQCRGR
jgi:hypothetical protein